VLTQCELYIHLYTYASLSQLMNQFIFLENACFPRMFTELAAHGSVHRVSKNCAKLFLSELPVGFMSNFHRENFAQFFLAEPTL